MDTKELDTLTNIAFINFFTVGKHTKKILLTNFDIKNSRHLACLHIAKLVRDMYEYEFYLDSNIFTYWKLNKKCRVKKWLKRPSRKLTEYSTVDVEDFISHIENANNLPLGFVKVYYEYFKGFDK